MSRANIQILLTVLQYHTPKMCFSSLPIRSFMEKVARIIPVLGCFFSRGLSFSCGIIQLEKLAVRRGCGGTSSNVSGRRRESSGFAPTLCFHTPQPYSLQLKCHHCATPPCLHGQNHPIIQAQPPAPRHLVLSASASHFQQAAVGSYCCCLADKHEK